MRYYKSYILLLFSLAFCCVGCKTDVPVDETPVDITSILDTTKTEEAINNLPIEDDYSADTVVRIRFNEIDIILSGTMIYDEQETLKHIQPDTVSMFVELGWDVEGIQISYQTENITDIKISQRYETSVSISDEGPHCDMINWKHYTSPWHQLTPDTNGIYITDDYDSDDNSKFPDVSMAEFKQAVREHCDEFYEGLIANNQSVNELPSHSSISRVFFSVTGKDKKTGKKISKLLIFEIAMGC
ncbi:MAG: hypothetical protein IPM74_04605 [Crocinitomicaceae bacterium]|nr:hypothetical protein [Crocinitomicaceae bacterium]MBK8925186.1 hypothetical protein [Crocinitomicaceae bacterium]